LKSINMFMILFHLFIYRYVSNLFSKKIRNKNDQIASANFSAQTWLLGKELPFPGIEKVCAGKKKFL
jgi:hypothetical protein